MSWDLSARDIDLRDAIARIVEVINIESKQVSTPIRCSMHHECVVITVTIHRCAIECLYIDTIITVKMAGEKKPNEQTKPRIRRVLQQLSSLCNDKHLDTSSGRASTRTTGEKANCLP